MQSKKLTRQQQKALYKWFKLTSDMMIRNGYTMEMLLNGGFELYITEKIIKQLWVNIQVAMCGYESTKYLNTGDINKIYDVLNKKIGEVFGEHIPFPCLDEIINQQRNEEN
jgi:hypothetical protein